MVGRWVCDPSGIKILVVVTEVMVVVVYLGDGSSVATIPSRCDPFRRVGGARPSGSFPRRSQPTTSSSSSSSSLSSSSSFSPSDGEYDALPRPLAGGGGPPPR